MSYGLSHAGYDVRIAESFWLTPDTRFRLASTMERFQMPTNLVGMVHDKSSWARRGLSLFNTVIEPGWHGYLTLELTYHGDESIRIEAGMPIAQIVFMQLVEPTESPYTGKYQNQEQGAQGWRKEEWVDPDDAPDLSTPEWERVARVVRPRR
jgi:dCTP deaminase